MSMDIANALWAAVNTPGWKFAEIINQEFGSFDNLKKKLTKFITQTIKFINEKNRKKGT